MSNEHLTARQMMMTVEQTANREHVVSRVNVEDLSELPEGHGTVVLPFEVCRGVGRGCFAAVPGKQLLHLLQMQTTIALTVQL